MDSTSLPMPSRAAPAVADGASTAGAAAPAPVTVTQQVMRVRAYYDETWGDYRILWMSPKDLSIHFGYWDETTRNASQAFNNMNRQLALRIGVKRGDRILDAGCGVGSGSLWLAREYAAHTMGITLVESQVQRAREFATAAGITTSQFQVADYAATGFPDGSFDVFWVVESLVHAPDKAQVMREAARLLRPGGRVGFVEYVRRERPLPPSEESLLRSWNDDWAIPDLGTDSEWRGWIAAAGFKDVEVVDITPNVRRSLRWLYFISMFFGFGEWLLRLMRIRTAVQHQNIRGSRNIWRSMRAGSWREVIITATRD